MGRPPKEKKERKPFNIKKYDNLVDAVKADISKNLHMYDFPEFSRSPKKNLSLQDYLHFGGPSQAPMNAVSYMQVRYKDKLEEYGVHSSLDMYLIARAILGMDK